MGSRCVSEPQAYARLKPCQFRGILRHFKGVLRRFKVTCDLNLRQCRSFHIKGVPRHFKGVPCHFKGVPRHFKFFTSQSTVFLLRKVQIFHFVKYRFFISQSTDFSFCFVSFRFAKYNKPVLSHTLHLLS